MAVLKIPPHRSVTAAPITLACPNCEQDDVLDVIYTTMDLGDFPKSTVLARVSVHILRPSCGCSLSREQQELALGQAVDRLSDALWEGGRVLHVSLAPSPFEGV